MSIETELVNQVIGKLHAAGFTVAVVGGYPRDLAHAKMPRDVDIVVLQRDELTLMQVAELLEQYPEYGEPSGEAGDFTGRIAACIKLECGADIIVADAKYKTVLEFVEDFDANMNKYILAEKPVFVGDNEGKLVLNSARGTITQARVAYLKGKAILLGWEV